MKTDGDPNCAPVTSLTEARVLPRVSVVIPARNEARLLKPTLEALFRALGAHANEVVVVDNESTDATPQIATSCGAAVLTVAAPTIGALRNIGVTATSGEILIFIDADVVLTSAWSARFNHTLEVLNQRPRQLTGAICTVPSAPSWLERVWFAPRDMTMASHIGTGHLITTRTFFDELGGFDEKLVTGEDYDLSRRALLIGGEMNPDPLLVAEHHGFPSTIGQFVRREAWHGRSDFVQLKRVLQSRVALATLVFATGVFAAAAGLLTATWWLAIAGVLLTTVLCFISSSLKFRRQPMSIVLANTVVFHAYYFGRLLAMLQLPLNRVSPRAKSALS